MKKKKGAIWMIVGLLLLMAALILTIYNMYDANRAGEMAMDISEELVAVIEQQKQEEATQQVPLKEDDKGIQESDEAAVLEETPVSELQDYEKYPDMEMPTIEIDGERYIGYLEIPALGLTLPVAGGEWSYAKLKNSPCLYSGSVYQDNMVVAAHNYVRHFGRLDRLTGGVSVSFVDADGNRFEYEVGWIEVVAPNDYEEMVLADDWDLTLFTCTSSGQNREAVRCIRK